MTTQEQKDAGFVVSLVGYSPYRDVGELLDPPNVRADPSRWGFMTRLENLDQWLGANYPDANCPLELYSRQAGHFKLTKEAVDIENVPMGVGLTEIIPDPAAKNTTPTYVYGPGMGAVNGTQILVDPMTREVISAEPQTDQYGNPKLDPVGRPLRNVHDYWFTLDFKLKWTQAPQKADGSTGASAVR
jgi:hypothetical protein